jgi:hypothetical protein
MQHQLQQSGVQRHPHRLLEYLAQGFPVILPKSPQGIMVRRLEACQPDEPHILPAAPLQLPGAANSVQVAVKPDLQQHFSAVVRTTHIALPHSKTKRR